MFLLKKDIDILSDRLIDVYVNKIENKKELIAKLLNIWQQEEGSFPELLENFNGYIADTTGEDVIDFSSEEYIKAMEIYYESKVY